MSTKKITGTLQQVIAGTNKNGGQYVTLITTSGVSAVFNRSYVAAICGNIGKSIQKLAFYAKQYNVSFDSRAVVAGETIGKAADGSDIPATKDHDRFTNLTIELRPEFMKMNMEADAIADALTSSFSLPSTSGVAIATRPAIEPAIVEPVTEEVDMPPVNQPVAENAPVAQDNQPL